MKTTKLLSLLALLSFITVATAPAAPITFDPTSPFTVTSQGGFTGTFNPDNDYVRARLRFNFSGLSPVPTLFDITGISIAGPGINSSLTIPDVTITGNGFTSTSFVDLDFQVPSLDFAFSFVSFTLPGAIINDDATLSVLVQYQDPDENQTNTSSGNPTYLAEVPPPPPPSAAIPEPTSVGMLLFGAAAVYSFRRRRDDV
jgi:hypothetical protein